jgi:hypothetical protein
VSGFALFNRPTPAFRGSVGADRFLLALVPMGRNSWMPQAKGTLRWDGGLTRVEVRMSLHPLVFVFGLAWLGMVGFVGALLMPVLLAKGEPGAVTPLVMVAFYLLLSGLSFRWGARSTKAALRELLDADEEPAPGR